MPDGQAIRDLVPIGKDVSKQSNIAGSWVGKQVQAVSNATHSLETRSCSPPQADSARAAPTANTVVRMTKKPSTFIGHKE